MAQRPTVAAAMTVLLFGGCATTTPEQERSMKAFRACEREGRAGVRLDRIEPDGRIWYRHPAGNYDVRAFNDCIAQWRRDNPAPPKK